MHFSVATNFESDLIEGLKEYPVSDVYGKLRQDCAGGGRAPYQLAPVSRRRLAAHVEEARKAGMGFNYLMNASCMGNREMTRQGQKELDRLLGWICDIGVRGVTVASPFMLQMVKARYPHLKVRTSVFAGVDRVSKAKMWEAMGADCIVLDSMLVNREFEALRRIRGAISCELELLVNNNCLMSCGMAPMHMNALAHSGQSWHQNRGFLIDWCFLKCTQMKLQDPVNYIRSEWIRPEDIHIYEEMGYSRFKIIERDLPTSVILKRVKAYAERSYEGNLLDLIQSFGFQEIQDGKRYYRKGLRWLFRYVIRPRLINPLRMLTLKRLADTRGMLRPLHDHAPVWIDNKSLDGFMERFKSQGCSGTDCDACRWCHGFAAKAVRVNAQYRLDSLKSYEEIFRSMDDGGMWRYIPAASDPCGSAPCRCMEA